VIASALGEGGVVCGAIARGVERAWEKIFERR
jgi:hypothetical protein